MRRGYRRTAFEYRSATASAAVGPFLPRAGNPTLESFPIATIASASDLTNPSNPSGTISSPFKAKTLTVSGAVATTGVDNSYFQVDKFIGGASGSISLTGVTENTVTQYIEANEVTITSGFTVRSRTASFNDGVTTFVTKKGTGLANVGVLAGGLLFYEINFDDTLGIPFDTGGTLDFNNTVAPTAVSITAIDDLSDSSTLSYNVTTNIACIISMTVAETGGSFASYSKATTQNVSIGGLDPSTTYSVSIQVRGTGGTVVNDSFEGTTAGAPAPNITGASGNLGSPDTLNVSTDVQADYVTCSLYTGGGDYLGDFTSDNFNDTNFTISLTGQSSGDFQAFIRGFNAGGQGPDYEADFSL